MARIHGRNGRLYVGIASSSATAEPVAFVKSFELNFSTDKTDVTAFGDSNKIMVAGLADASGSYAGYFTDTASADLLASAQDGAARKFYWYPSTSATTTYFFGTGFFDFSASFAVDGAAEVSGNWSAASTVARVG